MKSFSILFVTLGASMAMAYPAVGDRVDYQATYTPAPSLGSPLDYRQSMTISNYDATLSEYTLEVTLLITGGAPQTSEEKVQSARLPTENQILDLIAQCASVGGSEETLTVPKGTFQTCVLPQSNNGKVWIANVPFGYAKVIAIDADGNKNEAVLTDFARGN